jgi:hypothetical protein
MCKLVFGLGEGGDFLVVASGFGFLGLFELCEFLLLISELVFQTVLGSQPLVLIVVVGK